jgi:hypothetical protein
MTPSDRAAQLYPQAQSSLFFAFYDSQGYGGGILTHLHIWKKKHLVYITRKFRRTRLISLE